MPSGSALGALGAETRKIERRQPRTGLYSGGDTGYLLRERRFKLLLVLCSSPQGVYRAVFAVLDDACLHTHRSQASRAASYA